MSFEYPQWRDAYIPDDADEWYELAMQREDDRRKEAFSAKQEAKVRSALAHIANTTDDAAKRKAQNEIYVLRSVTEKHLGQPLDLKRTSLCGVCGRYHGKMGKK